MHVAPAVTWCTLYVADCVQVQAKARRVRPQACYPNVLVLMITVHDHDERIFEAIRRARLQEARPQSYCLKGSLTTTFTPEISPVTARWTCSTVVALTSPAALSAPVAADEAASAASTPISLAP
jgi:hypothetical protein